MLHNLMAYVVSHPAATVGAVYAACSFVIGLLPLSAQHSRYVGWLFRALDLVSFLTHRDAPNTLKLPGTPSGKVGS